MSRPAQVLALLAAGATLAAAPPSAADRFQRVADRLVEAINAGDWAALGRDFAPVMREALPPDKAAAFFQGVRTQHGRIVGLDPPRLAPPAQAVLAARFDRGVLDLKIVLDAEDRIIGLWLLPHVPPVPVPEANETPLALPFAGRWLVAWGGDTKDLNQHHDVLNQRFAFDFLGVDEAGRTHRAKGKANEDYACFGRPVLAPADGLVTDVISGVRDNVPGSMNPYSALGNAVLIQHREHEVSVLAHLKQGSVAVRVGDRVKQGQTIGACGNSGNSSEPHLHYHLQNTPVVQDAAGIRCRFARVAVVKDGRSEVREACSPVKGDVIEPAAGARP